MRRTRLSSGRVERQCMSPPYRTIFTCAAVMFLIAQSSPPAAAAGVPKPYTPVEATAGEFKCLGRIPTLGDALLPSQVVAAGKPVLGRPIRLVAEPDVLANLTGQAKLVRNEGDSATWEWA